MSDQIRRVGLPLALFAFFVWAAWQHPTDAAPVSGARVLVIEEATGERTPEISDTLFALREYCDAHNCALRILDHDNDVEKMSSPWSNAFTANKEKVPRPWLCIEAGRKKFSGSLPKDAKTAISTLARYGVK